MQAARWLRLAANKGEYRAQALLGAMLFKGEEVPRQAALGLFWLIVAKEGAGADDRVDRRDLFEARWRGRRRTSNWRVSTWRLAERAARIARLWLDATLSDIRLTGPVLRGP